MKYKDRDELVKGLRGLADFIEKRGIELPLDYPSVRLNGWVYGDYDHEKNETIPGSAVSKMASIARKLVPAEKVWTNGHLDLRRKFGRHVTLEFTANRNAVCTPKIVGKKEVPEQVIAARVEDIIEWECKESLLAESEV